LKSFNAREFSPKTARTDPPIHNAAGVWQCSSLTPSTMQLIGMRFREKKQLTQNIVKTGLASPG
jgi:hypothetical protein